MTAGPAVGRGPLETEIWRTTDLDPATVEAARRHILRRAAGWDDYQHLADLLGLRRQAAVPEPTPEPKPARRTPVFNTEFNHTSTRWQEKATCRDEDPELFFAPDGEQQHRRTVREIHAVAVCSTCPVRRTCLEWALNTRQEYGVLGGLTEDQRKTEKRRRARTNPKKAAA